MNGFGGPVEDRLALRELTETYIDAVHGRDADSWTACWTEDGCWNVGGQQVQGHEALRRHWISLMDGFSFVFMQCIPAAVRIDGDSAVGRSYVVERLHRMDGTKLLISGRYEDVFKRDTAARWRFAARSYAVLDVGS